MVARRYSLARAAEAIRASPGLPTGLLALAVVVILAAHEGGYRPSAWYPAALFLLGLLAVSVVARPARSRPSQAVIAAALLLFAYAAWSYLSVAWADDQGVAVDGAGRTLLYAVIFTLFAVSPIRGGAALALLGVLGLGIAGIGLLELLELSGAAEPSQSFIDKRLADPVGYHNGNVALWSTGIWPCALLAMRREVPSVVRGVALGGAAILVGLAFMGQSRGWFFSVPVVVTFFVAIVPGRARAIAVLLALAAAGVAMAGPVLGVYGAFDGAPSLTAQVDDAVRAIVSSAAALMVLGFVAALLDRRASVPPRVARTANVVVVAAAVLAVVAAGVIAIDRYGDPRESVSDAWSEFKRGELPKGGETRFTASLGSGRYDIWRVAWSRFEAAPLAGIGADNFQQDYLARGETLELPRYPHSVELRVLSQTGVVGTLLLIGSLAAAGFATLRARRRAPPAAAAAAAGASTVFMYWVVHGSVDWFWELPALGCAAFAMLGIAAALAPRRPIGPESSRRGSAGRTAMKLAAVVAFAAAALALALPWLAELRVNRAIAIYRDSPVAAYEELERARGLNPLSSRADLVLATVALERDDFARARMAFGRALDRNPRDHYANLELGLIAAQSGERKLAVSYLTRARRLHPRDEVTRDALAAARRGARIDPAEVNAVIRERAREVVEPD